MRRIYESGATKRTKRQKREKGAAKQKNSLHSFLNPNSTTTTTTTDDHTPQDNNNNASSSTTSECNRQCHSPVNHLTNTNESTSASASSGTDEILEDIALWPSVLTEKIRQQILEEKPKHIGNPINCGVLVKDRHRTHYRHFSKNNFYLEKSNGTKEKREWLIYSETSSSVYCYICKLFSKKKNNFQLKVVLIGKIQQPKFPSMKIHFTTSSLCALFPCD
jgi:hypothetical protein